MSAHLAEKASAVAALLEELASKMSAACEADDLEQVEVLDESIRHACAEALALSSRVTELRPLLQHLLQVYRTAIEGFSERRELTRRELVNLGRSPKAAQAYQRAGASLG